LQHQVLNSALPDDPFFESYLRAYFPEAIDPRFGLSLRRHRLRREIIAVEVANALIDTMGATFVTRTVRDTGAGVATVVRAWALAVAISGAADVWTQIDAADPPLPVEPEARCWFALQDAIERAAKWMIEMQPAEAAAAQVNDALAGPTKELLQTLPQVLPPGARADFASAVDTLAAEGAPRLLAERIVQLGRLAELFEVAHIAGEVDVNRGAVAEVYYGVGDIVDLDWVRRGLAGLPAEDRWERRAIEGLHQGLVYARRQLTRDVLLGGETGYPVKQCLDTYVGRHQTALAELRALIDDIKSARRTTLAALLVVMRALGRLAGRKEP
jgi:glutamate dehydrogenase